MKRSIRSASRGAALAEYAILVSLVSVVAIAAVAELGGKVDGSYDSAAEALRNGETTSPSTGSPGDTGATFAVLEPQSFFMNTHAVPGDALGRVAVQGTPAAFSLAPANAGVSIGPDGSLSVADPDVFGAPGATRIFTVTGTDEDGRTDQADIDVSRHDGSDLVHVIGSTSRETLATSSEMDRWRTSIDRDGRHVQFNLFPATTEMAPGQYLDLDFYDSEDNLLGGGRSQHDAWAVVNDIPAETNYIQITGYRSDSAGGYEFNSRYVDDIPDNHAGGQPYSLGQRVTSDILLGDSGDVFTFSTTETIDLVVRGQSDASGGDALPDFDIRLSDADDPNSHTWRREDIRSRNAVNGYADFIYNDLPAGNYFLRMEGSGATDAGDYEIVTEVVDDTTADWQTARYAWPATERGFSVNSGQDTFFAENDDFDSWCYYNPDPGGQIDVWSGHHVGAIDYSTHEGNPGDATWLRINAFQVDKDTGAITALEQASGEYAAYTQSTLPQGEIFFTIERYRTRSEPGDYTVNVTVGASERQPEFYDCQG